MKMSLLFLSLSLVGCSTFESKFTSHVGCPEEEIQVVKRDNTLIGVQSHTISCRGQVYHCTEKMADFVPTELRCKKALNQKRISNRK